MCAPLGQVSLWGAGILGCQVPVLGAEGAQVGHTAWVLSRCPQLLVQNDTRNGKGPTLLTHYSVAGDTLPGKQSHRQWIPNYSCPHAWRRHTGPGGGGRMVCNLLLTVVERSSTTACEFSLNSLAWWWWTTPQPSIICWQNTLAFVLLLAPLVHTSIIQAAAAENPRSGGRAISCIITVPPGSFFDSLCGSDPSTWRPSSRETGPSLGPGLSITLVQGSLEMMWRLRQQTWAAQVA